MSLNYHPRRRLIATINMVPFLDVMLVLLVVFMVASPLLTQGVEVDLPPAPAAPLDTQEEQPLLVTIRSDNSLFVNVGETPESAKSVADIQEIIGKIVRQNPTVPVIVWGDKSVSYGYVVSVMSLLQQAGATKIGLATEPATLGTEL